MYVIRYTSVEPVWNFGSPYNTPTYYHRTNYRRTFKTADLDRAFDQLDRLTAKRTLGARAVVRLVWRINNGVPLLLEDYRDERDEEYDCD